MAVLAWEHRILVIEATGGTMDSLEVRFVVQDAEGAVNVTDVMLQGGRTATLWTGHPSEIKWSFEG